MSVKVRKATIDDQSIVRSQLTAYLKELGAFGAIEETYAYLDDYWKDSTKWPYMIEVEGTAIGFFLINQWSPSGRGTDYAVAEFYIAPPWRGHRHGTDAARQVFHNHPGQWELAFFKRNVKALTFWPAAILNAGAASYERLEGPGTTILRFVIPGGT